MSAKPKLLLVSGSREESDGRLAALAEAFELVEVRSPIRALACLSKNEFAGVFVDAEHLREALKVGKLLQNERILQGMPDGVVLLDSDNTILWGNGRLREWSSPRERRRRRIFTPVLGSPEILGP